MGDSIREDGYWGRVFSLPCSRSEGRGAGSRFQMTGWTFGLRAPHGPIVSPSYRPMEVKIHVGEILDHTIWLDSLVKEPEEQAESPEVRGLIHGYVYDEQTGAPLADALESPPTGPIIW